jgi:hypothetical protein
MTSHNFTARERNESEGDVFMEGEQPASLVSAITEQFAVRLTTDSEGDTSMEGDEKAAEPGSAVLEQLAIRLKNNDDDAHKALSPGVSKMMDVDNPAHETTTSLTSSHEEDYDPARMQLATELATDIVQRANEWDLAGRRSARHLAEFRHRLSLAPSVGRKLDICQPFFDRMAGCHKEITRARRAQQKAFSWTMKRMPRTAAVAHRHLIDEYIKGEAQVEEIIESLKERAKALVGRDT